METELPTDSKYKKDAEEEQFFRRVLDQIHQKPGVSTAAVACSIPLDAVAPKAAARPSI